MTPLTERAKALLALADGSVSKLAAIAGVKPPSVSDWLNGKTQSLKAKPATRMAKHFRLNGSWVSEGVGKMRNSVDGEEEAVRVDDEYASSETSAKTAGITLRSYPEVSAAMGPGQVVPSDWVPFEQVTLSLDWAREYLPKDHGSDLVRVNGHGDSMEPFFHDGDLLICDIGFDRQARLRPGIYLFRVDGELFAKRLERIPDGWRALNGDGSEAFRIGRQHQFEPVARVLAAWKRDYSVE
jgi:phage repressor protein C with HTH and peptisase S24 domain